MRAGIPSKPLDVQKGNAALLSEIGIRSGDVIIVQEEPAGQSGLQSGKPPTSGGYYTSTSPEPSTSSGSHESALPSKKFLKTASEPTSSATSALKQLKTSNAPLRAYASGQSTASFKRDTPLGESGEQSSNGRPVKSAWPQEQLSTAESGANSNEAKLASMSTSGASIKVNGKYGGAGVCSSNPMY